MTDIYLDDYHLHSLVASLPSRVHRGLSGLESPEIRIDAYDNPGEHGTTIANTLYGQRLIALEGSIRGDTATVYRANRQALREAVSLKRDANSYPIPRYLKFNDAGGYEYRVPVVTKRFQMVDTLPTRTDWLLELLATSYAIESETVSTLTVTLPQSGGVTFPITFPITFGASSGGTGTATNNGTAEAYPTITLTGPAINPTIYNETTGERIGLTLTLGASDSVVIDMARRTVLQGGSTNRMGAITTGSSFWALSPGDNLIRFAADSYDTGTANLSFRSAYLGL